MFIISIKKRNIDIVLIKSILVVSLLLEKIILIKLLNEERSNS